MELKNRQITREQANKLADFLAGKGYPTEDRLLIVSPTGEQMTAGGIIISASPDNKELPRKGVVIQNNSDTDKFIKVGSIVTYGMYAGKEIHFDDEVFHTLGIARKEYKFTILSTSEVVYVEQNKY